MGNEDQQKAVDGFALIEEKNKELENTVECICGFCNGKTWGIEGSATEDKSSYTGIRMDWTKDVILRCLDCGRTLKLYGIAKVDREYTPQLFKPIRRTFRP